MICKYCGRENPREAKFCASCGKPLAETQAMPQATVLVPGVSSSYGNAWRKLWKKFLELFLILIITFVIGLPASGNGLASGASSAILTLFAIAYSILVVGPIEYGMSFAYLKAARGDTLQIKDMFESFHNYWNAVLASLMVGVIVIIGFFVLVIPGIYFTCKLAFTPYLVVDRKMSVIEAVKESWRMTDGHFWKIFLIYLLAIPIVIAGLICLGIGVIISIMWIELAIASLYHAVSMSGEASLQQRVPIT